MAVFSILLMIATPIVLAMVARFSVLAFWPNTQVAQVLARLSR